MKKLWGNIGVVLFWLGWPLWLVYFRFGGLRSRVLVLCGDEFLLLQSWLGANDWGLPGGGCKKGERPVAAAVRELKEETGIIVTESSLKRLGSRVHTQYGLRYHARFFSVELASKPELKLRKPEIHAAVWVRRDELSAFKLDTDAQYAFRRHRPAMQERLL
jgi:8-oxo-dGTP pyrophosphatase MutT (NUDIX family)